MSTASVRQAAREEKFVECYLAERSCDASKAYRAAFGCSPGTAKTMARAYLKRFRVQILIEQAQKDRARRMGLSAERVIEELWRIGGLDIGELYRDDGTLRAVSEMSDAARGALAGLETIEEFDSKGNPRGTTRKARGWDKVRALELLAKHFGLIVDRKELSGPKGGPIEVTGDIKAMTTEELLAEKERLLADT